MGAGEAHDRVPLPCNGVDVSAYGLPGCQGELVSAIIGSSAKFVPNNEMISAPVSLLLDSYYMHRTIIMVLMHGGGVTIDNEMASPRISAILDVYYPRYAFGEPIRMTLFGSACFCLSSVNKEGLGLRTRSLVSMYLRVDRQSLCTAPVRPSTTSLTTT